MRGLGNGMALTNKYDGYLNDWLPMIQEARRRGLPPNTIANLIVLRGARSPHLSDDALLENHARTISGLIRHIFKLKVRTYVREKTWTLESNYHEIAKEYK